MNIQERPGTSMIIDVVDPRDRPVGTISRREVLAAGQNFRVAHLFLFDSRGDLLIQQLSSRRERHPLAWGSSVAGYLFAGETYDEAILRRTKQELGRAIQPVSFLGRTRMEDVASEKFIGLFGAQDDGPFDIDQSHIERIEFLPMAEISRLMNYDERPFTPTFRHLFQFYSTQTPIG